MKKVALIGYSGHSFVVADTLQSMGFDLCGYFEKEEKENNPFHLPYLGWEGTPKALEILKEKETYFFVCIGSNRIRAAIISRMLSLGFQTTAALHSSAFISENAGVGNGTLAAPGCKINAMAKVGSGVIVNTGSIVEHECFIEDYVHIAPGAVLAGNVTVGANSFIGANAVVKEGVAVGKNVVIGAGSVVLKNVPDNETWVGNPGKKLDKNA